MSNAGKRVAIRVVVLGVLSLVVAGCGGSYDASVRGIATLNNSPLPGGTVKFTPEQQGTSGYGLIGDDGSYSIMTGRERGLQAGSYVVTVVANEPSVANANPSIPPTPGKPITPLWYRDPSQSPLKYTVEPGKNEIDLELTSQPPAGWKPPGGR